MNYLVVCGNKEDKIRMIQKFFLALKICGSEGWQLDLVNFEIKHKHGVTIFIRSINQLNGKANKTYHGIYRSSTYNLMETYETSRLYDYHYMRMIHKFDKDNNFLHRLIRKAEGKINHGKRPKSSKTRI
ncbi:hypothetical protein [Enterococcus dispar]|uniref:hypothetical protein n=1 Tax=Enterococcus dispar TaxID=44009 RepID=UPI0021D452E7|nr:hypothetical protein [Enterococcus dispar]MCU7356825.1 hypothetical protein [Enterococcus dispar]MDT2704926.1 hypothetical protein [Enterococcus dispar]